MDDNAAESARKKVVERMVERRQRDVTPEEEAARRLEQLPPEEREAFARNLKTWRELPPDERQALRGQADERMKAETDKALQDSGLRLDNDQREVFALRYRQERRRLERQLQDQLNAERARELPGILERLKREFADKSSPANNQSPAPVASASAGSPTRLPIATPSPSPAAAQPTPSANPTLSLSMSVLSH